MLSGVFYRDVIAAATVQDVNAYYFFTADFKLEDVRSLTQILRCGEQ